MAKYQVDIAAGSPRMSKRVAAKSSGGAEREAEASARQQAIGSIDEDGTEGVFGIEHKPHLSVAVLRAVGLYKGDVPASDAGNVDSDTRAAHDRARALHNAFAKARGVDAKKAAKSRIVRDARDSEGAIFLPPPESNDDCLTAADAILLMSHRKGGYFERTPIVNEDGTEVVTVRFTYGDTADVVTGSGAKTKDAVRAMFAKLGETFACLEPAARAEGTDNE